MKVFNRINPEIAPTELSCSMRKSWSFMPQVAQRCHQNLRLQGPRLAGSSRTPKRTTCSCCTFVQPRFCCTISLWPSVCARHNRVWPGRCNWCWLHHTHGSCCNFKSHLEGFTGEASSVSNSATLIRKKRWPSFFTPVIQAAPNTIHTPCWLGWSSISQRQALLEPQGQSPELAINFHGSVHRLCWNLWKDCSFTSLQHPFVAFEVEWDLQIQTPTPKQIKKWNVASPEYKYVRKVFLRCCFQVKCLPQHKINRLNSSCCSSVQEGKEFQWQKKQRIRLSIYVHTALRWQVRCWKISLWRLDKYLERMRMCVCIMHASFHSTYCTCGGWMCVVHIHRYRIPLIIFLSTNIQWVSIRWDVFSCCLRMLALFQAMMCLEDVVECQSKCVLCLGLSRHLQSPSAKQP